MKVILSDRELLDRYKRTADLQLVADLFERYAHLVSVLCMKYLKSRADAEDAAMDIFEILVRDLGTHEVINFKAWLYQVTKNHCFKRLNKMRSEGEKVREMKKSESFFMEYCTNWDLEEEELIKTKRLKWLEEGIQNLSAEQKECIQMFYIEENSYREVSERTGYTLKEVKSFLQNGKRNLANHIDAKND